MRCTSYFLRLDSRCEVVWFKDADGDGYSDGTSQTACARPPGYKLPRELIVVTGSARLDLLKRGGDSLMGRYFPYRVHPLSVVEVLSARLTDKEIHPPRRCSKEALEHFLECRSTLWPLMTTMWPWGLDSRFGSVDGSASLGVGSASHGESGLRGQPPQSDPAPG